MTVDVIREPAGTMLVLPPQTIGDREVDHRVANSLQLISSLLSLQARQATDASVQDALATAVHRIGAVGAIHKHLNRSGALRTVDIAGYLFDLAETIERGFGGGAGRKQISAHVQAQIVSPDFASVLGILITELVINACKHAYAPDEPGDVEICLFFPTKSEFRMEVRDYGGKPARLETANRAGLGTSIIQAMCCKLSATYALLADAEGRRCQIRGAVSP
jgi:two-component sensor histidine kinase